jgi:hypothetical protein
VATLKLSFVVWIVMGHIGGASPASSNCILTTPSIALNIGKMDYLKMLHCVTWNMFLSLVIQAQVVPAQRMETCLEIVGLW